MTRRPGSRLALIAGAAFLLSAALNAALIVRYRLPPRLWNRFASQKLAPIPDIPIRRGVPEDTTTPALHAPGSMDPAAIREWKVAGRAKLRELVGVEPATAPVPVRTVRVDTLDDVVRETLVFTQVDGVEVPAFLLRPSAATTRPGLLVIPGHSEGIVATAGIRPDYQHSNALRLAQAGFVVLTMEVRGFGYLTALDDQDPPLDRGPYLGLNLIDGESTLGIVIRDADAGLDYLASRSDVRPDRIGVVGFSSGCLAAMYLGAIDTRAAATVASGCVTSNDSGFRFSLHDPYSAIPGIARWLETSDVLGLISPRPLLVHWGELDHNRLSRSAAFNPTALPIFESASRIFAADSAAGAIEKAVTPGLGHEFDVDAASRFLLARLPLD